MHLTDRIFDHPKGLINHKIDINGYFSKQIKSIYKYNMLLNELLTEKVILVWILSDLFLSIHSNPKEAEKTILKME